MIQAVWGLGFQTLLPNCPPQDADQRLVEAHKACRARRKFRAPKTQIPCYASWGPIFLETPRTPDKRRPQALNRH